ncbi:MAG: radical SAM protein [Anaerolineae bacterium CG_4_9_14_3_um_filter_57_17]|nr:radical SAM protein [bacterium]NCT20839.1 radical SAM protein [bacterium]OIO84446.1 MAG: radical SAM protein [Anaerolineae bacterium CG2_30_57_67]PJB65211.1 MAG: radical SAM protein [Anaerolineae bacterium CG_4_9_14_3_um_filter_57_17]
MKVFALAGNPKIATVYMADMGGERMLEFVEACQPPYPREERWILMVSTLYGCPVKCLFCDAGGGYRGKPNVQEILAQIDYMVAQWFPGGDISASKFKIQFARMGEPALNMAVLDVLEELPRRYRVRRLIPSISTIAPLGTDPFFERLIEIKDALYPNGNFQFQYSIHTTDVARRDELIPVRKWDFARMAKYGTRFYKHGDRKITLNFALAENSPIETDVLLRYFDPARFLIKLTPVNPTSRAIQNNLASLIDATKPESAELISRPLLDAGYKVIVSIGEVEENEIGSNCGQYVLNYLESGVAVENGYSYAMQAIPEKTETVSRRSVC